MYLLAFYPHKSAVLGGTTIFMMGVIIMPQIHVTADDSLMSDIRKIAEDDGKSQKKIINEALSYYRDMYYCKNKATFLNENIVHIIEAMNEEMEDRINNKSNQLLSEMAIQLCIVQQILADNLEVDGEQAATFRKKAVEFLKMNQRVFYMRELID